MLFSCAKDNSNYNYSQNENMAITGLEPTYTLVSLKDKLILNPTVTSNEGENEGDFSYMWGIYETNVQGSVPKLDTIAKTKNLVYDIKLPAKTWVLVYKVTNNKTGYSKFFNANLVVVTEYTRGWYVAKDDGAQADLDLFLTPTNISITGKQENVYSGINGTKLNGIARQIAFHSSYKSKFVNPTGAAANTRTLFFVTDKDIASVYLNTLQNIRTSNNIYFEPPTHKKFDSYFSGSSALYIINNGGLASIYNMSSNDGRFGATKMSNANNDPYHLSPYFAVTNSFDPQLFDDQNSQFLYMNMGSGASMAAITDDTGTAMPAKNNNKEVVYMGGVNATAAGLNSVIVFKDKTDPSLKILAKGRLSSSKKLFLVNDTLKTSDKIYNATMHTVNLDENIIYFVVGNELWSRNLDNKAETKQLTLPAGETFTFVRHKKFSPSATNADLAWAYNNIIIGSSLGGNYKIRFYTKSSGNLTASPSQTIEGTGNARDIFFVSPTISENSYVFTY